VAITILLDRESGSIWPGDAVFNYEPADPVYPLHVGIYIGMDRVVSSTSDRLAVRGLPGERGGKFLGESLWGDPGHYEAHVIGRRRDVGRANVGQVVLVSSAVALEHSRWGSKCEWKRRPVVHTTRKTRDGIPLFMQGTCAHFVEYLYEQAGLDLVKQDEMYDPSNPHRLYPATQIHAFRRGVYPLRAPWDPKYASFPECLFGPRGDA
jgi:hypothetical protein